MRIVMHVIEVEHNGVNEDGPVITRKRYAVVAETGEDALIKLKSRLAGFYECFQGRVNWRPLGERGDVVEFDWTAETGTVT